MQEARQQGARSCGDRRCSHGRIDGRVAVSISAGGHWLRLLTIFAFAVAADRLKFSQTPDFPQNELQRFQLANELCKAFLSPGKQSCCSANRIELTTTIHSMP